MTDHKRNGNEVNYSQFLEEVLSTPGGATQGGEGREQRERGTGAQALVRVCGWSALGVPGYIEPNQSIQTKKWGLESMRHRGGREDS